MTPLVAARRVLLGCGVMLATSGCAFSGLNSLPLPGAVGRPGGNIYHVEIGNVGTMEANSPVMIDDVIVGSISKMTVRNWHADIDVALRPGVAIPANSVAKVGQTSLLGSMHLELGPPLGQSPSGRLQPGATIPLNRSSTYPSTEQTLSSLSVILNAGGLGQIGDIIHSFNAALSGRTAEFRDLLARLDTFVGTFNQENDNLVASLRALNRLSATFAGQRDVITQALYKIPPALEVLDRERPRLTAALDKLGEFSHTATRLVNDAGDDLVKNLQNLAPTISALADVGPDLDAAIAFAPTFPWTQGVIDRDIRGDYLNGNFLIDLTNAGLRRAIGRGTHWERVNADAVPAPGDPQYLKFQYGAPPGAPGAITAPGPSGEPARVHFPPPWAPGGITVHDPGWGPAPGPPPGAPVGPQSANAPQPPPPVSPLTAGMTMLGPLPSDKDVPMPPGAMPVTGQPTGGRP